MNHTIRTFCTGAFHGLFVGTFAALAVAAMLAFCGMQGCAVAKSPDGTYVLGVGVDSEPGSASSLAESAGDALALFGVPGGKAIATLGGGLLAAIGFGAKRHADAKAEREASAAHDQAWDEATARSAGRPVVLSGPSSLGDSPKEAA